MFKSLAESPTVNIDCWPPVNTEQLYCELQFSAAFAIAPNRVTAHRITQQPLPTVQVILEEILN